MFLHGTVFVCVCVCVHVCVCAYLGVNCEVESGGKGGERSVLSWDQVHVCVCEWKQKIFEDHVC